MLSDDNVGADPPTHRDLHGHVPSSPRSLLGDYAIVGSNHAADISTARGGGGGGGTTSCGCSNGGGCGGYSPGTAADATADGRDHCYGSLRPQTPASNHRVAASSPVGLPVCNGKTSTDYSNRSVEPHGFSSSTPSAWSTSADLYFSLPLSCNSSTAPAAAAATAAFTLASVDGGTEVSGRGGGGGSRHPSSVGDGEGQTGDDGGPTAGAESDSSPTSGCSDTSPRSKDLMLILMQKKRVHFAGGPHAGGPHAVGPHAGGPHAGGSVS